MSQIENVVISSLGTKRTYRKSNSVPTRERQRVSLARRSSTHKILHAVTQARLKDRLSELVDEEGITQAQMLEKLIESELKCRATSQIFTFLPISGVSGRLLIVQGISWLVTS